MMSHPFGCSPGSFLQDILSECGSFVRLSVPARSELHQPNAGIRSGSALRHAAPNYLSDVSFSGKEGTCMGKRVSTRTLRSQGQPRSELTRALCCGCSPCSHRSQNIDPMWNGSRAFFEAYVDVDRQRPDIILTPSHMHAQKCLCLLVSLRVSCEKL